MEDTNTFIFECCDDQMESVCVCAPTVRDVFERDKVSSRVNGSDALAGVATRQIGLQSHQIKDKT